MPLPSLPPDPDPTHHDLAPLLNDLSALPENLRVHFAEFQWRDDMRKRDPDAFLVPFAAWIGDLDYDQYLKSPLWRKIRKLVLTEAQHQCWACGGKATEVHHRDYRPRVLDGRDLLPLVPICRACHKLVHYDATGRQRDSWNESEHVLAQAVSKLTNSKFAR